MKTTFIVLLQCIKTNQTLNKLIVLAIIVTIGFPYNIQNLFLEPRIKFTYSELLNLMYII